jgi:hypothetical protein
MMLAPLDLTDIEEDGPDAVMRVWAACTPAPADHPYLARYRLAPGELRVWKGGLIGPLRDDLDRICGLLIVDGAGLTQRWLPYGGQGYFRIGTPGDTAIIAVSNLAEALALHHICGHQVFLTASVDDAWALKARLTSMSGARRILVAGLTMAEASSHVAPRAWSEDFVLLPVGSSWASLRLQSGFSARSWIDDPVLVFHGVTPVPINWLRRSGLWTCDDDGNLFKLCGPLTATAMVRTEQGTDWSRLVWLIDRDGVEQTLRVSERDLLMNGRRVVSQLVDAGLDIGVTFGMAGIVDHLRLARITTRLRLVERGGWHDGHYLASTGTIGPASHDVPVRSGRFDMAPASDADDLAKWQNEVAALAEGNSRLVLALCAAFAGLAIGLLPGQGSFGLHLRGLSSTGKSTALAVAASIFGSASREIRNWRSTDAGVEAMAEAHHNRLLILDEIAQIDPRAAAQVGYTLANGVGKQRASGSGRARQSALWQLVFLSSGEISLEEKIAEWAGAPAMREGQIVRVMDLPADAGQSFGLFDHLHGFANGAALSDHFKAVTSGSTGQVAVAFVERLASDVDAARLYLKDMQARFLAGHMAPGGDGLARRAMGNFALLAAAGEMAIELGILPWSAGHAMDQVARCARDWIAARGEKHEQDPLTQARDWLDRNAANFSPWETAGGNAETEFGFVRKAPLTFLLRPKGWQSLCDSGGAIEATLTQAGLVRNGPARLPGGKLMRFRMIDGQFLGHGAGKA